MPGIVTDEITYSSADASDISVVYNFCAELIEQYEDLVTIDYDGVLAWVRNKISSHIGEYTCVYWRGIKVGYYRLIFQNDETELDDFYIFPEFRCKGIGTVVLKRCISCSKNPIFLYVFSRNTRAIRLYETMGFVAEKTIGNTRKIMRYKG